MSDVKNMCILHVSCCIVVSALSLIDMLIPPPITSLNLVMMLSILLIMALGVIDLEYFS